MAKGCDSSWDFDYKSRVDALVDEGYTFIGRYLNHSAGVRNGLTVSEANRLSNAGVFICALYESDSGTSISHFTRSNGIADAREAISLAEDLGMPTGNPIYFCIDTDVTKSQMTTYIVPYVQGILSELEGSGYKLGIYGPKPVCKYIRGTYSATERYMMICDNDWGQSGWSATERDFDDWNIRQYEWNQSLPGVSSVTLINANRLPTVAVAGSCNKISKNEEWETYYPHYLAVRNNIRVAMEIL